MPSTLVPRTPPSWRNMFTVALAMPEGMPVQPDGQAALRAAGVRLVEAPLYQGQAVSEAIREADVVISGGVPIGAEVFAAVFFFFRFN